MLKNVEKSKILLSFIAVVLMIVLFGNIYSLATEENATNTVTITATTDTTGATNTNNTSNTNTNTNSANLTANNVVNTPNVSASANNTTNNKVNNTANNTSTYNNTNSVSNSSNLPYTGTNSKAMLLIVVFAISAVYAYKKVSDYNM